MASRGRPSKQGTPFDRLIKLQCQKAVTSKSSGVVGKWGSFSSMRLSSTASSIGTGVGSSSDLKRGSSTNAVIAGAPKPKKFFKSREAAAPIEDDMDFTDSSVSQIVPTPPKRVLKPLEPKPPAQQIQAPAPAPPHAKSSSKFFTSKQPKPAPEPVPQQNYNSKPRRAAAERVTRQDYAESDSDESPAPPIPQKPVVAKAAPRMLVSKGKPSATLIHQQQQQQQQQQKRATRQARVPSTTGKTIRNSEESDATEESSSEEDDESDSIPAPKANKFLTKVASHPVLASSGDRKPIEETPDEYSDGDSNRGYSDSEPMADGGDDDEVEEHKEVVPPLKVPPLKLILKQPSQQPQQPPAKKVDEEVIEKRASRRGRPRYQSDKSEPDIVENPSRTLYQSNTSENDYKAEKKGRTRYQSNNSENEISEKRSGRTRLQSNNSENELVLEKKGRTRKQSNHIDYDAKVVTRRQSTHSETEVSDVPVYVDTKPIVVKEEDDELTTLRHPSRTRTYGSRQPKVNRNDVDTTSASTAPSTIRSSRRNPLSKIEEEELLQSEPKIDLPKTVDETNNTNATASIGVNHSRTTRNKTVLETEEDEEEGDQLSVLAPSVGYIRKSRAKPFLKADNNLETRDSLESVDLSKNSLRKPEIKTDLIVPEIFSDSIKSEVNKTSLKKETNRQISPTYDLKPPANDLKDEDDVPEKEREISPLIKARTLASYTNIEAELSTEIRARDRYKRPEPSSQPMLSTRTTPATTIASSSVQKRSIFKSKSSAPTPDGGGNGGNGNKKGLSLYKHKWNSSNEPDDFRSEVIKRALTLGADGGASTSSPFDDDFDGPGGDIAPSEMNFSTSKLVRVTSDANKNKALDEAREVVSVKCHKAQKEYFTVIKNVKKAHQIQDSGEFQEFNDDVDYILGGLGAKNSLSTRCLSTVTLASKCMEAPFRMHLRAHGTVTQFFSELKDAPKNPSLALCAATVLFVLSQDRLNMDLDRDSLELMLNLLDTDSRIKDALDSSGMNKRELEKNKQKVQELCGEMKKKGHAANLSLEDISADHLSMETLLSLTSKRAGEWFKEELRELGGLDHLVNTMSECVTFLTVEEISLWTEPLHNKLKKAGRVLKVLESVTSENEENCDYLLEYNKGQFLDVIHTLYKFLDEEVPLNSSSEASDKDSVSATLRDSLLDVIRVYINLVHDYKQIPKGSVLACQRSDLFDIVLHCLFVLPESLPAEKRFDVLVLTLTFIINLVENSEENRAKLMRAVVPQKADALFSLSEKQCATEALVQLFLQNEENARNEESKTDQILDGVNPEEEKKKKEGEEKPKSREEVIDETVAQLLHKAGRHMEDTLIASYITLIIGYLILDDKDHEAEIREILPEKNFVLMVTVLKKFFNFMNLTASATLTSSRGIKATEMIIKHLEKIDKKEEKKEDKSDEDNFDDVTLFDVSAEDGDTTSTSYQHIDESYGMSFSDDFGKL